MKRTLASKTISLMALFLISTAAYPQQAAAVATPVNQQVTPQPPAAAAPAAAPKVELPNGVFYFWEGVSDSSVLGLTKQIEVWCQVKENDGKPIRIIMNSPGGSVFAAFALMDEIAAVRVRGHHVTIETYGMAASAAGFILQAADTRVIGANSWVLIHQISTSSSGKYAEIVADLKLSGQLQDQFLQRLSNRSKLSLATIHEHIDQGQDWWISADDALKYGLVDSVQPTPGFAPNK